MKRQLRHCILLFFVSFSLLTQAQFYAGMQQEFGKNRVQYRDFNWLYLPYDNLEVYYYQGGEDLAAYTLEYSDRSLKELEAFFDYALEDKVQIIVYNKQSEFRQSNIGITGDDQYNIGGTTRIIGSKVFVYYEGSHAELNRQIKKGLARILINQMMYGGDWKEVFKNSTLLTLPDWYIEGIISFATRQWSPEVDALVKDGIQSGKYDKFNRLNNREAVYAGHSLWKYIADVYGQNVIPNILYMTRISRNIENGFLFVLGTSVNTLTQNYLDYYNTKFDDRDARKKMPEANLMLSEKAQKKWDQIQQLNGKKKDKALKKWEKKTSKYLGILPVKFKKKYTYDEFHVSPDGEYASFATDQLGQYKVWLYHIPTGKLKRVYKGEYKLERIHDDSYPILCWHPSSKILTFTLERKGRVFLVTYNLESKKKLEKELFRIDKVVDLSYSPDGTKMIFSGVNQGQTDLYLYYVIGNNQKSLTDDIFDDLEPRFLNNGEAVVFSSNRPDDTLRTEVPRQLLSGDHDIYVYHIEKERLTRVTDTPKIDERQPKPYGDESYTYLSDKGGIFNRYIARIDSSISRIDTTIHYRFFTVSEPVSDFSSSTVEYSYRQNDDRYYYTIMKGGRMQLYSGLIANDQKVDLQMIEGGNNTSEGENDAVEVLQPIEEKEKEIDFRNYTFENERKDYEYEKESIRIDIPEEDVAIEEEPTDSLGTTSDFELPKSGNYRVNFATDYVLSQIDNTFTNRFYQPFSGPTSMTPGISGLIKLGASDLFEDYKIVGGFRLAGNLDNNDYGLRFEDLKRRLDRVYSFQRQSLRRVEGFSIKQYHTHTFEYQVKWPFTELLSLRASLILRNDRTVFLSTDLPNLRNSNINDNNLGVKLEYVFDNTINRGLNLYNGSRYKVFAEYYQSPTVENTDMLVLGADFRHYQKIHRDLILTFRLAGSTSLGSRKIIYYLGAVDNWLFQRIDEETQIDPDQGYAYQALGSPMRGFFVNSRNGNSFAVANTELRWPVFRYFLNKPIKSDFVENFQVIGFTDVGSAWTGLHPYDDDNSFNTQTFLGNPVQVTIDNNREPIVWGYGFGLRSRVLGYFIRADWAWGVDDGIQLPRVFYLSLNLDF